MKSTKTTAFIAAILCAGTLHADIYLNGVTGNDGNDGLTTGTAVKTFVTAKAKLAAQGAGIINVTGEVTISSDTVLSFSDTGDGVSISWPGAMVQRGATYPNIMFDVSANCSLTLTNIVIDGNRYAVTAADGMINTYTANSRLKIQEGAVLRNASRIVGSGWYGGAAVDMYGSAQFVMSGGYITNNSCTRGGAIGLHSPTGSFDMSNGVIEGNETTSQWGGGIFAFGSTFKINLSGNAVIRGNYAVSNGGGIGNYVSTLTVTMSGNAVVSNNVADVFSGGISCTSLEMSDNARVSGNFSKREGGGVYCKYLTMSDSAGICDNVTSNTTASYGAGAGAWVTGSGSAVMSGDSFISDNVILTPGTSGGGIYLDAGTSLVMSNSASIYGNTATGTGGGIYMKAGAGWLTLAGGMISSNTAAGAAGIFFGAANGAQESRIEGMTIEGNVTTATGNGGGCTVAGTASRLYLDNVRFIGNSAGTWGNRGAGAIYVSPGAVVCSNSVFLNNSALGYGGAVDFYSTTSNSVFRSCVFRGNVSKIGGGAIRVVNPLLIEDCVFDSNLSTNGSGGAIWLDDYNSPPVQLTARRCLFTGNASSNSYGGAIFFRENSGLPQLIENCTFFGNVAKLGGSAIYASGSTTGDVLFDFCTFRGNTNLNSGGAVYQASGSPVSLSSTAVAYNYTGATITDVSGTLAAADHCYFTQSSNTVAITSASDNLYLADIGDPKLADVLVDNGGTMMPDGTNMLTLALAKSSPLREKGGDGSGIATDQRGEGWPRVSFALADIGAFEYTPPPPNGTVICIR